MEKNNLDISRKDFKQHNQSSGYYHYPSPTYPKKPNEFDKLVYVASAFYSKPKSNFKHANEASLFQTVVPRKK